MGIPWAKINLRILIKHILTIPRSVFFLGSFPSSPKMIGGNGISDPSRIFCIPISTNLVVAPKESSKAFVWCIWRMHSGRCVAHPDTDGISTDSLKVGRFDHLDS